MNLADWNLWQKPIEQKYMKNLQFISHNLIHMLAVRLAQIFVQQNTMTDSETSIHAIHNKQKQISHIACLNNHTAQNKEDDKGDTLFWGGYILFQNVGHKSIGISFLERMKTLVSNI